MTQIEEILAKARQINTDDKELKQQVEEKLKEVDKLAANIRYLLRRNPETADFMKLPEQKQEEETQRSYKRPIGKMIQIPAGIKVYKCPECDYMWLQNKTWETPPLCPEHEIPLELIDET